jgi:hypothetical protein
MTTKQKVQERRFLYKRVPEVHDHRRIESHYVNEIFGVDLIDFSKEEGPLNKGFCVVAVDYHSRYAMTKVITHKTKAKVEEALKEFFASYGQPKFIHSDREAAIIHSKMLKDLGIEVYHTSSSDAHVNGGSPICERLIQTLKIKLEQYRDVTTMRAWKQHIDSITDDYNHTVHRTIKMKPNDAFHNTDTKQIDKTHMELQEEHENKPRVEKDIHEDDAVVVPKEKKNIFEKGYTKKWKEDVLTVVKVLDTVPKTYELSDGTIVYGEHAQKLNDKQVDVLAKPKQTKKAKSKVEVAPPTADDGIASRTRGKTRYPHMVTG